MRALRWLLLVPTSVVVWYAVFVGALATHFYVGRHFCPPGELISGSCQNETLSLVLEILMHFSVALSAVAVEVTAAIVAPSRKEATVWATLAAGTLAAAWMGVAAQAWSLLLAALLGGVASAIAIVFVLRAQAALKSSQADSPGGPVA